VLGAHFFEAWLGIVEGDLGLLDGFRGGFDLGWQGGEFFAKVVEALLESGAMGVRSSGFICSMAGLAGTSRAW
jgi:hypothetical protein